MEQTEEQKIRAYQDAGVPLPTVPKVLNSTNLTPVATNNYQAPSEISTYPISSLNAEIPKPDTSLATSEKEADSLLKSIMGETSSLTGESAYRAEQEIAQGIPELQKTQTDLSARLKALQNEEKAIPLQLQQESEGRGRTVGGLAPLQTEALRKNAIQALTTSSLLEASRGNLATALDMVDRAVAQKYNPIKASREAKIANLELLMKSPAYTEAQKKRAQAQLDYQKQQQEKEKQQEQNSKEIWNIATTGASNGNNFIPTAQYPSLALALDAINKSQTKEQALAIASATGLIAPAKTAQSQVLGSASTGYFTYDPVTGKTTPISGGAVGGGGVTGGGAVSQRMIQAGQTFNTLEEIRNAPVSTLTKAVMAGTAKLKDLTPTDKSKVASELFEIGFNPQQYVISKLQNLVSMYESVPSYLKGVIQGRLPFASDISPDAAKFDSAKTVLTREIARLNDVGVLSDQDVLAYRQAMPARSDSSVDVILAKLAGLGVAVGERNETNIEQPTLNDPLSIF